MGQFQTHSSVEFLPIPSLTSVGHANDFIDNSTIPQGSSNSTPSYWSHMKTRNMLVKIGISGAIAAAALTAAPAVASADPLTDFLCNSGSAQFCPVLPPPAPMQAAPAPQSAPAPSAFEYKNCDAARDAGAAPVYRGDYGYGPHLDRDNDGIGCE